MGKFTQNCQAFTQRIYVVTWEAQAGCWLSRQKKRLPCKPDGLGSMPRAQFEKEREKSHSGMDLSFHNKTGTRDWRICQKLVGQPGVHHAVLGRLPQPEGR